MPDSLEAFGGGSGFDEFLAQSSDAGFHAGFVVVILVLAHELGDLQQGQPLAWCAGQASEKFRFDRHQM